MSLVRVNNKFLGTPSSLTTDGILLYLDAGNSFSYPGTGTSWFNLLGNPTYTASIVGTNRWENTYGGVFNFGNDLQVDDYIIMPEAAANQATDAYTLETWLISDSSQGANGYFHSMAGDGVGTNYHLNQQYRNLQALGVWNATGPYCFYTELEPLQFVEVKYAGVQQAEVYLNGSYVGPTTSVGISSVDPDAWILNQEQDSVGGGFQATQCFTGAFAIVRLYNRALSSSEIASNFFFDRDRFGI